MALSAVSLEFAFTIDGPSYSAIRSTFHGPTALKAAQNALLLAGGHRASIHAPAVTEVERTKTLADVLAGGTVLSLVRPKAEDGAIFVKGETAVCHAVNEMDEDNLRKLAACGAQVKVFITRSTEPREIHIKTLTGKVLTLTVTADSTVADLKALVQDKEGIPPDQQRLIHNCLKLQDEFVLADYGIGKGCTVNLVLRLRGGMFHETSGKDDYNDASVPSEKVTVRILDGFDDSPAAEFKNVRSDLTIDQIFALVPSRKRSRDSA